MEWCCFGGGERRIVKVLAQVNYFGSVAEVGRGEERGVWVPVKYCCCCFGVGVIVKADKQITPMVSCVRRWGVRGRAGGGGIKGGGAH